MVRFCHNHGLLQIMDRPQGWTVQGGAGRYVEKITAHIADKHLNTPVRSIEFLGATDAQSHPSVRIHTDSGNQCFDIFTDRSGKVVERFTLVMNCS